MKRQEIREIYELLITDAYNLNQDYFILDPSEYFYNLTGFGADNYATSSLFINLINISVFLLEKEEKNLTIKTVVDFWKGNKVYPNKELTVLQQKLHNIYTGLQNNKDGLYLAFLVFSNGFDICIKHLKYTDAELAKQILQERQLEISNAGVKAKNDKHERLKKYTKDLFEQQKNLNKKLTINHFANKEENIKKLQEYAKEIAYNWCNSDYSLSIRRMLYKKKKKNIQ